MKRRLSTVGLARASAHRPWLVVAEQSGHYIHQTQPDLVLDGIRQVVEAVRDPAAWGMTSATAATLRRRYAKEATVNDTRMRTLTGVLLVLLPIAFNTLFTMLSMTFAYPDLLREDADTVLRKVDEGGSGLMMTWYGFMLTAVLFVPLAVLVHRVLAGWGTPCLAVAIAFGALVLRTRSLEDRAPRAHPAGPVTGELEPLATSLP